MPLFVTSPNLMANHWLPGEYAPSASLVIVGNSTQSARSWAQSPVAGFQVNPRLALPAGSGVGLRRIFT